MLLFGLLLAAIPFVLPIASWVAARRTRSHVEELSRTIREQQSAIERLSIQIAQLKREARTDPEVAPAPHKRAEDTTAGSGVSHPSRQRCPPTPAAPAPPPPAVPQAPPASAPVENPWPELARPRPAPARRVNLRQPVSRRKTRGRNARVNLKSRPHPQRRHRR